MTTQQPLFQMNSPNFNSSLEDFLAKVSALLETDEDFLTKHEGHSFLISQGFSPHDGLGTWYWRMLKVYLTTTREGRLKLFSEFSPTLGMTFSGKFSIVGTSECHKIGNESILSDILEPRSEVDPKYFLSQKQVDNLKLFNPLHPEDKDSIEVKKITEGADYRQRGRTFSDEGITEALDTGEGGGHHLHVGVRAILTPDREEKRQNGRRMKDSEEPSFTLTSQDQHGVAVPVRLQQSEGWYGTGSRIRSEGEPTTPLKTQNNQGVALPVDHTTRDTDSIGITEPDDNGTSFYIRRLTPTECERLQSFPDGWTDGVSNTQRYKMMGNAVTVNVVETVMRRLFRSEDTSDNE